MSYRYEVERATLRCRLLPNVQKSKIGQENNLIAELFKKYPNLKFWAKIKLPFSISTFADLFTPAGKAFLQRSWSAFTFQLPERPKHALAAKNLGEDREVKTKPRTLREFLNG